MRVFSAALLCAALLVVPVTGQGLSGRRAPSFSIPDSALNQHDLLDYRGHWLILDFMQTNCPHCKALSKTLEEVKTRYGPKVATVSVVVPPDTMATVAKYIQENKITATIVFDSGQVAMSYFKATPSRPGFDTPHWFAINPAGMIVRDWGQNSADSQDWVKEFDQLVAGTK
jgi:peroxiredoxin